MADPKYAKVPNRNSLEGAVQPDLIERVANALWNRTKLIGCSKGYHEGASDMLDDASPEDRREYLEYAAEALEAAGITTLQAQLERVKEVLTLLVKTCEQDEVQGYRSNLRTYVLEIGGKCLADIGEV